MKGIVIYYSASGNTMKIAKAIHKGMRKVIEADIASIKRITPEEVAKYDLIGVGSPVWFFREPANVKFFLYRLPKMEGKHCFLFCTHGTAPYWIFASMASTLQRKGLKIIGWADWYGAVEINLHMPKPYFTDGHPDEVDLKEAEEFGRRMAERFLNIISGRMDLIPEVPRGKDAPITFRPFPETPREPFPGARPTRIIDREKCRYPKCRVCIEVCPVGAWDFTKDPPLWRKEVCWNCLLCERACPTGAIKLEPKEVEAIMRTQKKINLDKCTFPECMLCVENCPMNAIDFTTAPPSFKYNCEGCDLCWCICPKGAIELVNVEKTHAKLYERLLKDKMEGKLTESIVFRTLQETMAKGLFRPLVPLEKIGFDTPLFKSQKIPRYILPEDP
ncbi:MAG: EFR1 family ferrodoxin [Candidatus Bathyarchaeia archaeon]